MNGSGSSTLCFGKLPSHADFIRFNAAGREALAFDEWLHQGLYFARTQLGTRWEQQFAQAPAYRFLFGPENASGYLAGVLQASQDRSQRRYPFLVSLLLDRSWLRDGQAHLAPAAFSSFFEGAGELIHRAMNGLDLRQIVDTTQSLNCPEPDFHEVMLQYQSGFLESTPVAMLWEDLFGSFDAPRKYLLFHNLAEVLLPVRRQNSKRMNLGLRFPLSGRGGRTEDMVCFWMSITRLMLGGTPGWPFLFWNVPGNGTPAYLFLFFKQPSPKNFVQLLKPDADSENICPVDQEGSDAADKVAHMIPTSLKALLDKQEGSLSGFLKGLTVTVS